MISEPSVLSVLEYKMRVLVCALLIAIAPFACRAEDQSDPPHPALAAIQANLDHCKDATPGDIPERLCTTEAGKVVDALLNKCTAGSSRNSRNRPATTTMPRREPNS